MRRATLTTVLAAALAAAATTTAAAGNPAHNHAAARAMLVKCLRAANTLVVGPVMLNTPEVPQRNRQQQAVYAKCDNTKLSNLAFAHPKDQKLEQARQAFDELELGIGDYGQYLVNAAFGKHTIGLLHSAEREISTGKREVRVAIRVL